MKRRKYVSAMLREKVVFGPISSRRLGASLGINLLPENGKLCNFDCIYCECGWNRDGRGDRRLPDLETVRDALESKLKACVADGIRIDSLTFSGDGEPTLHPDFPAIIDLTLAFRDRYCPDARVSVLTNATRLDVGDVFAALRRVDSPILKLDAPTTELACRINRPQGKYDVDRVVAGMKRFEGDFILQTMFLRARDFDSSSPEVLLPWMDIVRDLHPREIMAYTIARPTPQAGLAKFSVEEMAAMLRPLIEEGFNLKIYG